MSMKSHTIVIGAGIAGLISALKAHENGERVTVVALGVGGAQLGQGTFDVLGPNSGQSQDPFALIKDLGKDHPYHGIGIERLHQAIDYFRHLAPEFAAGDGGQNILLPTAIGAMRPTYLAPKSMIAAQLKPGLRLSVVGIREYRDLYPELLCGNLNRQELPDGSKVEATPLWVSFPARKGEVESGAVMLAKRLDDPLARRELAGRIRAVLPDDDSVVAMPAVLGYSDRNAHADMELLLGRRVAEIPSLPPCLPGIRLNNHLVQMVKDAGIAILLGARAIGARIEGDRVATVRIETAGRERELAGDRFIHCAGGFESWGLALDSHGHVSESVFNLPVSGLVAPEELFNADWYRRQPLFAAGIAVDKQMRPVDTNGKVVYQNLFAAGSILAGATRWHEKSGEGIAAASAVIAADAWKEGK